MATSGGGARNIMDIMVCPDRSKTYVTDVYCPDNHYLFESLLNINRLKPKGWKPIERSEGPDEYYWYYVNCWDNVPEWSG